MNSMLTQDTRLARLDTPLGKDVFFDDGVQYWVNPRLV